MDAEYVRRKKGKAHKPKNTILPLHYGGGNIMLWRCTSPTTTDNLIKVQKITRKEDYISILYENVRESTEKFQFSYNRKL